MIQEVGGRILDALKVDPEEVKAKEKKAAEEAKQAADAAERERVARLEQERLDKEMKAKKEECKAQFTGDKRACACKCMLEAKDWLKDGKPDIERFMEKMNSKKNGENDELVDKITMGTQKCFDEAMFDQADPNDETCQVFKTYGVCLYKNGKQLCSKSM